MSANTVKTVFEDPAVILGRLSPLELDAMEHVTHWSSLKFPPEYLEGWVGLARAMAMMCPRDKFGWLRDRVLKGMRECPTPLQMRGICTIGKDAIDPLDGIEYERANMEDQAKGNA